MVCCQHGGESYQLIGLLERALSLADGTLARLAREFGDLIQLLCQVCLDELELGLVGAEQLGASIGVERVGHGCGYGGDCGGVSAKQRRSQGEKAALSTDKRPETIHDRCTDRQTVAPVRNEKPLIVLLPARSS